MRGRVEPSAGRLSLDVGPDGVLYVLDESTRAVAVLR